MEKYEKPVMEVEELDEDILGFNDPISGFDEGPISE